MAQRTSAASSLVERARPSERHAKRAHRRRQPVNWRVDQPDQRYGTSGRGGGGTTASAAPSRIRSGRGGPRLGRGGTGAPPLRADPHIADSHVREDFPDDRGIVQRADQAQPAPRIRTRQDINRKGPMHQARPAPSARTALHPCARQTSGERRRRGCRLGRQTAVHDHLTSRSKADASYCTSCH